MANEYVNRRLVLDYNEACTNEEDCQDWIVKIKVKVMIKQNHCQNKGKNGQNKGKSWTFILMKQDNCQKKGKNGQNKGKSLTFIMFKQDH